MGQIKNIKLHIVTDIKKKTWHFDFSPPPLRKLSVTLICRLASPRATSCVRYLRPPQQQRRGQCPPRHHNLNLSWSSPTTWMGWLDKPRRKSKPSMRVTPTPGNGTRPLTVTERKRTPFWCRHFSTNVWLDVVVKVSTVVMPSCFCSRGTTQSSGAVGAVVLINLCTLLCTIKWPLSMAKTTMTRNITDDGFVAGFVYVCMSIIVNIKI